MIKETFQKIVQIPLTDIINIFIAFLTFLSVIGVFVTLREMKVQRNMAYSPSIVMKPVEVSFEWDEFGNETWLIKKNEAAGETCKVNEDGTITVSVRLSVLNRVLTECSVVNIGVGTAKNIVFKWDESNTRNLNDYLVSHNPSKADFCEIGEESDVFTINDGLYMVGKECRTEMMYMLPEAGETYSLYFPLQYTLLINEAVKAGYMNETVNPYLILRVSYHDIQEKLQKDIMIIRIGCTSYQRNEDGSGKASYQLIPAFPSEVVE